MKRLTTSALLLAASMTFSMDAGIQIDPTLTAAIVTQTDLLKDQYKKRSDHHSKIEVAQAAIAVAMENVHKVEEKVLEYMSNASGAMQNLIQLKKITELVTTDIPDNLVKLGKDIPDNIKGTAITLVVNNTITDTTADIVALSGIVSRLVTSHYSFKDSKDSNDINLLSAAERFSILQDVYHRLTSINRRIYLMNFYIKTFSWKELWRGIDRESWCNAVYGEMLAKQLINKWKSL